jgi:alkylhydroperoxidase family enzyme
MERVNMPKIESHAAGTVTGRSFARAAMVLVGALALQHAAEAEPRIAPLSQSQWDNDHRAIVAEKATEGQATNLVATYLHHPQLAASLLPFEHYIANESTLPARHRQLLGLRTAWLTGSEYLWAHRADAARDAGFSAAEIERVASGPDAAGWEPFEAALVRAADELLVDSFVSDATWQTLASRYDNAQLVDLPFTVGAFTLMAGTANSVGVEIEPELSDRFPAGIAATPAAPRTNHRLIGRDPRIAPLPREEWSPEMRALLDPNDSGRTMANVYPTYAQSLRMDLLRRPVGEHIRNDTTLTDRQREILLLRIGVLCRAEYEWAAHYRIGLRSGLNESDIEWIVAGPDQGDGDPVENLLLRATDELYRDAVVSAATWEALQGAFDTRQLLDIVVAIGGYRMFSMAMNSYGVQLDPNATRFPPHLR